MKEKGERYINELHNEQCYKCTVNQVCLKLPQADRALQKLCGTTFDDCYTQTMFWKNI